MTQFRRIKALGVPVIYKAEHEDAASAMAQAVEETASVVEREWGLSVPSGCEVHVLTDWEEFLDQTVPNRLRLLVKLTKPFWRSRVERTFPLAGGWMMPWPGRPSVGVKPPELLARVPSRLGDRLFEPVPDLMEKVRHLTSHEFTHACTAHLKLPPWLNEGIAMRAVDHMVGRPTVLEGLRSLAEFDLFGLDSRPYRRVKPEDHDGLIRLYATGYWVVRQLEEERPTVLDDLLKQRRPAREVTRRAASALRLSTAGGSTS